MTADAWTASYTTAWAGGGAVVSSGTIAITGPVTFSGNAANAGSALGGSPTSRSGGRARAPRAGDNLQYGYAERDRAFEGSCRFSGNSANASGATVYGTVTLASRGGAIENTGTLLIPPGACACCRGTTPRNGADIDSPNLLAGPWQFVSSDLSAAEHRVLDQRRHHRSRFPGLLFLERDVGLRLPGLHVPARGGGRPGRDLCSHRRRHRRERTGPGRCRGLDQRRRRAAGAAVVLPGTGS